MQKLDGLKTKGGGENECKDKRENCIPCKEGVVGCDKKVKT